MYLKDHYDYKSGISELFLHAWFLNCCLYDIGTENFNDCVYHKQAMSQTLSWWLDLVKQMEREILFYTVFLIFFNFYILNFVYFCLVYINFITKENCLIS